MHETEEFTAAAPHDPDATGAGETSFADADAPPAAERAAAAEAPEEEAGKARPEQAGDEAADAPAAEAAEAPADKAAKADERQPRDAPDYLALAQRTQADFDNYRKRMAREVAQAVDRGVAKLAKELLPALDHLDIALRAAEGHEDVVRGFALVREEFVTALRKAGIEPFSPTGAIFDPNEHEAMASLPAEDAESGTVIEVYQQGYRLHDAVLRPARVVVAQ